MSLTNIPETLDGWPYLGRRVGGQPQKEWCRAVGSLPRSHHPGGFQSLIWSWALCYLSLKDLFETCALSFWQITWVKPVKSKKRMAVFMPPPNTHQLFGEQTCSSCSQPEHSRTSWGELALLILQNSLWRWMSPQSQETRKCLFLTLEMCAFSQQAGTIWALRVIFFSYWSRGKFRLKENLLLLFANISEKWVIYSINLIMASL